MRPPFVPALLLAALALAAAPAAAQSPSPSDTADAPGADASDALDAADAQDAPGAGREATLGERLGGGYLPLSFVGLLAVCAVSVAALATRWKP